MNPSQDTRKLSDLKRKRGTIKGMLTQFEKYVSLLVGTDINSKQKAELQLRLASAHGLLDEFNKIQTMIEELVLESEIPEQLEYRETFDNSYYSSVAEANCLVESSKTSHSHSAIDSKSNTCNHNNVVKLPTISLPKFDGNYDNWLEFRDSFLSMIHNSSLLDNIQKYHYLRSSLTGNALQVIKSLEFCSDNYIIAWELVENRYNNNKLLIYNHVKALFSLSSVTKESPGQIRKLIDNVLKNLRALKTLGEPTEAWDTLLIYIITSKLDSNIEKDWEQFKSGSTSDHDKSYNLESLLKFLKDKADTLEMIKANSNSHSTKKPCQSYVSMQGINKKFSKRTRACVLCNNCHHALYACQQFLDLGTREKLQFVKSKDLCINCLRAGHTVTDCQFGPCRQCGNKHNSLLHPEFIKDNSVSSVMQAHQSATDIHSDSVLPRSPTVQTLHTMRSHNNKPNSQLVLLSTALVEVLGNDGKYYKARALLDSGSQHCIISKALCTKLNIKGIQSTYQISGIGQSVTQALHSCELNIRSLYCDHNMRIKCLVLQSITMTVPATRINAKLINIPKDINLADPNFSDPAEIDILIGADYFWDLLLDAKLRLSSGPYLLNTMLGWIIAGPLNINNKRFNRYKSQCHFVQTVEVNEQLKRFWEIEELHSSSKSFSLEERNCEELFVQTTKRVDNGRFSVRIPLRYPAQILGDSYETAKSRFLSLERKLERNTVYKNMYCDFMREYVSLGHMSRLNDFSFIKPYYVLPHHGVLREDSVTTKLRVVFDGSQKTSSDKSLNDIQYIGPALQNDLFSILLRFRQYRFVACADIEKLFRQVLIHEEQRNLQLILWRERPSEPLSVYRLNTVTYGTASAPFLSMRCIKQLGLECEDEQVSRSILEDFYVDDYVTGSDLESQLQYICNKVYEVCQSGCFPLRKWVTNSTKLVINTTSESANGMKYLSLGDNVSSKTLGLGWYNKEDEFHFTSKIHDDFTKVTKRSILSIVSQIYDPLGLLCPTVIVAKVLLQKLWLSKVGWDEILPQDIILCWKKFVMSLYNLNNLRIPRYVMCISPSVVELHIFTDASQTAYGACAYIRTTDVDNNITVKLLCAKSRVAPIKPLSIPRLELCGALIGAKLKDKITKSLRVSFNNIIMWTDSTIVLGWLKMSPNQLKTFVQNRVVEINDLTSDNCWYHIDGTNNPADLLSRGVGLQELNESILWWRGPAFLQERVNSWSNTQTKAHIQTNTLPEMKSNTVSVSTCLSHTNNIIDFHRFSAYNRLERSCAYVSRFIYNVRIKNSSERYTGSLSVNELKNARIMLMKLVQMESFSQEINDLVNNLSTKSSRNLSSLNIFLDDNKLLRVGGRLCNSNFDYDKKHPILLCSKHYVTLLLLRHKHIELLHAGPQLLLSHIRDTWWILGGRNIAKQVVQRCLKCYRMKASTPQPIMGNLPSERLQASFPFIRCGVDYAGPLYLLNRKGRGSKLEKCYLCLFICFATKALHLELVTSLSTEGYLMSLKRFISRRGKPIQMFSDNGRNFVGAAKEFAHYLNKCSNDIIDFAIVNNIEFKFIPPYSPHFGGLWEAGVKSCKYHISRVVGNAHLTYEEFSTVLTQIEAVLNSRPLYPLSTDPNDFSPLTPAHFLVGRPLTAPAEPDVAHKSTHSLSRYQRLEQLRQHFWARWAREYVSELQQRMKWKENKTTLVPNTLVLIKDDNLSPLRWRLGRILSVFPGKDGVARVASLRTATGVIERAFSKICPLPLGSDDTGPAPASPDANI